MSGVGTGMMVVGMTIPKILIVMTVDHQEGNFQLLTRLRFIEVEDLKMIIRVNWVNLYALPFGELLTLENILQVSESVQLGEILMILYGLIQFPQSLVFGCIWIGWVTIISLKTHGHIFLR